MKILCIEDDENIAEIVKIGLESAGWTVEIASSGTEGIELAREGGWGLLVVDGMLPGMDGIEICGRSVATLFSVIQREAGIRGECKLWHRLSRCAKVMLHTLP